MSPVTLQPEDHARDAAFKKVLHGDSAQKSAFMAMISKDSDSQAVAADAYFKHWDNKDAKIETQEDREVSLSTSFCLGTVLTRDRRERLTMRT